MTLSKIDTKKAAAEGLVISEIRIALKCAQEALSTGGVRCPEEDFRNDQQMMRSLTGHSRYSGGYMHAGRKSTTIGNIDINKANRQQWTKMSAEDREAVIAEETKWKEIARNALKEVPVGTIAQFYDDWDYEYSEVYEKRGDGLWKLVEIYDGEIESQERSPWFLPPGIREKTAEIAGVDASETFHHVFDYVIHNL